MVFDYVAAGGRRPLALVVDLGVETDGGYQGMGGDADVFGFLDEVFEGGAERGAALGAKAGGVGVAVNDGVMGDFVLAGDGFGADPAEVVIVDEFAVFVMADRAFAGVPGEVCGRRFFLFRDSRFGILQVGLILLVLASCYCLPDCWWPGPYVFLVERS